MNYLLIHGSWHGAWAFEKLLPHLTKKGHQARCLELPGSGNDAANAPNIVFDDLHASVYEAIKEEREPIAVVAHSFSGFIAAMAREALHDRVQHVYYIAAWLPQEGKSLVDLAVGYNNSKFPSIFVDCGDHRLRAIDKEGAKSFLYHDCSLDDQNWAALKLRPKAAQPDNFKMPPFTPTHTLKKSTYVVCTIDRVVNPISQIDMAKRFGFSHEQIKSIEASHAPFISRPKELVDIIG